MNHPTTAQLQRGVIIEFDFAVLDGHSFLLDICRARLEKEGVKLDAPLMARSMGGKSFSSGLNALCHRQHKTVDVPTVIADCNAEFVEKLAESLPRIPEGFLAFVKALLARNLKVVVVTRLESEAVLSALESVRGEKLSVLHDIPNGFGFNTWEGWRRAARKSDLHDRLCVAVAGSGHSVKGALVARPNPLTEHQDFGGCDASVAEYTAALANEVTRILRV